MQTIDCSQFWATISPDRPLASDMVDENMRAMFHITIGHELFGKFLKLH